MTGILLTKADFTSSQEVRWCPGCGDYAILSSVQKVLPELGVYPENTVFISGIGCSSRFPYYLNTYGFHTIHGRATAIASGLKIARPDLNVWIVTGDGDALSIGTNHLLHLMRRNINVTILLLNNQIYGLTKGQYSPTSEKGKKTKTSPQGSLDEPLNPVQIALAAGCTFVARAIDVDSKNLQMLLKAAHLHQGTSFIEIYQNCNVFNDGAFAHISDRGLRDERTLNLINHAPLVFGENQKKGLKLHQNQFEIIEINENNQHELYIHHTQNDIASAIQLNQLFHPQFPVPMGIFRQVERPCYEVELQHQMLSSQQPSTLKDLLHSGNTWTVE